MPYLSRYSKYGIIFTAYLTFAVIFGISSKRTRRFSGGPANVRSWKSLDLAPQALRALNASLGFKYVGRSYAFMCVDLFEC